MEFETVFKLVVSRHYFITSFQYGSARQYSRKCFKTVLQDSFKYCFQDKVSNSVSKQYYKTAISVYKSQCLWTCFSCVCTIRWDQDRRFLVEGLFAKIEKLRIPFIFRVSIIFGDVKLLFFWQSSLLCMFGELAKGGSVAVAVLLLTGEK